VPSRHEPFYWVSLVPRGAKKVRVDLTSRVLSYDFEDVESKADKLKLTVDNWDLANFDTPVWRKGNIIETSFGYADGAFAPARQLIIRKVTGATKLTVEAVSKVFLMDREMRLRVFENQKRSDIIRTIAMENGFSEDTIEIDDTGEVIPFVTQSRMTDAKFMRRLASKEGFEFYVDFDGLHWHERRIGQKPVRKLTWFNDQRGEILDFDIENDISPIPGKKTVRGRNHLTKKNFEFVVDYTRDFSPQLAPQAEVTADLLSGLGNVARIALDTTSEAFEAIGIRKTKGRGKKEKALTVKMKATIIGDPLLLAKTVVNISGIGGRLSGNYYTKKVRHRIGTSGYKCELELLRDGHSENRAQEKLFAFIPGEGGASGGALSCIDNLKRVQVRIDELIQIRDEVWVGAAKKGATFGAEFSQFIGSRVRQLRALRPQVTKNPKSADITVPVLNDVFNIATELYNNETLRLSARGALGLGRVRGSAHGLAMDAESARRKCRLAAGVTEPLPNKASPDADEAFNSREQKRLEQQRLQAETQADGTTRYKNRHGRGRGR